MRALWMTVSSMQHAPSIGSWAGKGHAKTQEHEHLESSFVPLRHVSIAVIFRVDGLLMDGVWNIAPPVDIPANGPVGWKTIRHERDMI